MIWDMLSTGKTICCALHIYFSSMPLPVVGEGPVELLENLCPGAQGAGTATSGASS